MEKKLIRRTITEVYEIEKNGKRETIEETHDTSFEDEDIEEVGFVCKAIGSLDSKKK